MRLKCRKTVFVIRKYILATESVLLSIQTFILLHTEKSSGMGVGLKFLLPVESPPFWYKTYSFSKRQNISTLKSILTKRNIVLVVEFW